MAARRMEMLLMTIAVVATLWAGATAQSSSCTNVIRSMSPCLDYITGNSSTPSSSCCSKLASVVGSQPQCLCEAINGDGSSLGININQTQALGLPSACNVQTPSLSRCNAASPAGSPAGTPPTSSGSDGNSNKLTFSLLFFMLFVTSCASIFTTAI